MKVRELQVIREMVVGTALLAGCGFASGQVSSPRADGCYTPAGGLADTLYLQEDAPDVNPPRPRQRHLAPYPPAADGDLKVRFRGADYYATGMPVRVAAQPVGEDKLVRIGQADSIPIFALEEDALQHGFVLAPITDNCVFLPYRHESEMH